MAAPNELSFLPDDYLERKARRRTNAICAVLFCVVISAIGGAFTVTERSRPRSNACRPRRPCRRGGPGAFGARAG